MADMEPTSTTETTKSLRTELGLDQQSATPSQSTPISDADRLTNLEQAVAAGQYERRQLLKHLVARDEELTRLKGHLSALGSMAVSSESQVTSKSHNQSPRERPEPFRGLSNYLVVFAGIVAIGFGLFYASVGRRTQARLERETGALRAQIGLETQAIDDRRAAVQKESDRLSQFERDLKLERQNLTELKGALEAERVALEKSRATSRQAGLPIASGVMVWRGELTASTTVMINVNRASFGTVSGALPGKPATLRVVPFYGKVTILEDISPANGWGRFHFQVEGQGPVTVFLLWV
jgi:hypothetical protein